MSTRPVESDNLNISWTFGKIICPFKFIFVKGSIYCFFHRIFFYNFIKLQYFVGIFPNNFASVTGNFLLDNRLDANVPDRRNILIILHFLFFYWTL